MREIGVLPILRGRGTVRTPRYVSRLSGAIHHRRPAHGPHPSFQGAQHAPGAARPLPERRSGRLSLRQRRAFCQREYRDTTHERQTAQAAFAERKFRLRLERHIAHHLWSCVREHVEPRNAPQRGHALHVGRKHPQSDRPALSRWAQAGVLRNQAHHSDEKSRQETSCLSGQTSITYFLRPGMWLGQLPHRVVYLAPQA